MEILSSIKVVQAKVKEHTFIGEEKKIQKGIKHFRGNAKVFVIDAHWGTACDIVTVIGQHRSSGRYAKLDMPSKHLANFNIGVAYSPKVLELIHEHFKNSRSYSESYADDLLSTLLSNIVN